MTLALLWDIDGTLLTTGRAGIFAWEDAVRKVIGDDISLADYPTAGLTDVEIARRLVRGITDEPDHDRADCVLARYGELLPASLHRRTGRALPGVRPILEHVLSRDDVISMLLTGNIAAGARAKLTHYDLAQYFDFERGAFSDGTDDRPEVARRALRLVREAAPEIVPECMYVIGDTPSDIQCGRAIGARTVAVATGSYAVDALREYDPWWVVPELPDPGTFLSKLTA